MSVVESRSDRPCRNAEQLSDLGRGVPDVVVQDEDHAFVGCKPTEAAVELVAIGDADVLVGSDWTLDRHDAEIHGPSALARRRRDADVGEQTMDPGVEPVRIAGARKVTPGDHQRILEGILGQIDVPEDPMRDRKETVAAMADQVDECRLVAPLRRFDEVAIHRRHLG